MQDTAQLEGASPWRRHSVPPPEKRQVGCGAQDHPGGALCGGGQAQAVHQDLVEEGHHQQGKGNVGEVFLQKMWKLLTTCLFPGSPPGGERSILDRKQWESDLDLQQDDACETIDCHQDERYC